MASSALEAGVWMNFGSIYLTGKNDIERSYTICSLFTYLLPGEKNKIPFLLIVIKHITCTK